MSDTVPDFTLNRWTYGSRMTRPNLNVLLYKGGAVSRPEKAQELISSGQLGKPLMERLVIVSKLHSQLEQLDAAETVVTNFRYLRHFFIFVDSGDYHLTLESLLETYVIWTESLDYRSRVSRERSKKNRMGRIGHRTAYGYANVVGTQIDRVLQLRISAKKYSKVKRPPSSKSASTRSSEKHSLEKLMEYGAMLQDICDTLTIETVLQKTEPVAIPLRDGRIGYRYVYPGWNNAEDTQGLGERMSIALLRIEAEFLMFIAFTSMNSGTAFKVTSRRFSFASHLEGYTVKDRKGRRHGDVEFKINKDYRPHFERYLAWLAHLFPNTDKLFPFYTQVDGTALRNYRSVAIRYFCKQVGTPYFSPAVLRKAKVNWILRRTGDPDLTANVAQHHVQTLFRNYEEKSQQRAMAETGRFWNALDPHTVRTIAVAPGECSGSPQIIDNAPKGAIKPDCEKKSGCFWCRDHRDVDSPTYVWSLTSFRHLKLLELTKGVVPLAENSPPAQLVVERIDEKLDWFCSLSEEKRQWVADARNRIEDGFYHEDVRIIIHELEGLE